MGQFFNAVIINFLGKLGVDKCGVRASFVYYYTIYVCDGYLRIGHMHVFGWFVISSHKDNCLWNDVCQIWYVFLVMSVDLVRILPSEFNMSSRELSVVRRNIFCVQFQIYIQQGSIFRDGGFAINCSLFDNDFVYFNLNVFTDVGYIFYSLFCVFVAIHVSALNYLGHFSILARVTSANPSHSAILMINFSYRGPLSSQKGD